MPEIRILSEDYNQNTRHLVTRRLDRELSFLKPSIYNDDVRDFWPENVTSYSTKS